MVEFKIIKDKSFNRCCVQIGMRLRIEHNGITKEELERRKQRLGEYRYIKLDFDSHVLELERLQATKIKLTSVLTGMPTGNIHKRPDDRWGEVMDETDELLSYIRDRANELLREIEAFERAVNKLPARERAVLIARYIVGMQFKDILKKFPLSESSMYDIHQSGLTLIDMTELDEIALEWY